MTSFRALTIWGTAILCGLTAGCQVYLSGGPGGSATIDDGRRQAPEMQRDSAPATHPPVAPPPPAIAPQAPDAAPMPPIVPMTTDTAPAPAVAPVAPARPGGSATFPGERYYPAGQTMVVLRAVEDALQNRDFRILSSGTSPRGGEVHAERREKITPAPHTSSTPAWKVQAAVIRIAGSSWDDCCYVRPAFTTTRLNSRGDVLGTTAADEPENHVLRSWFFEDLAAVVPAPPAY